MKVLQGIVATVPLMVVGTAAERGAESDDQARVRETSEALVNDIAFPSIRVLEIDFAGVWESRRSTRATRCTPPIRRMP